MPDHVYDGPLEHVIKILQFFLRNYDRINAIHAAFLYQPQAWDKLFSCIVVNRVFWLSCDIAYIQIYECAVLIYFE